MQGGTGSGIDKSGAVGWTPEGRQLFDAKLLFRDHSGSYGAWTNVALVHCRKPPGIAEIANFRKLLQETGRAYPDGIFLVTIVESVAISKPEARLPMQQMFDDLAPRLRCAAFVLEAVGVASVAQRAIATSALLAAGRSHNLTITASVDLAASWIARRLFGGATVAGADAYRRTLADRIGGFRDGERAFVGQTK